MIYFTKLEVDFDHRKIYSWKKNHVKSNGDFLEIIEMNVICAKK